MPAGRPRAEFDVKQFTDLIGLGCGDQEICWWFRDPTGKPANIDTLSRWCVRTFGMNFQEFRKKNGGIARNIQIRKAQLDLCKRSAAMAIFLGKQYLGQTEAGAGNGPMVEEDDELTKALEGVAEEMERGDADE